MLRERIAMKALNVKWTPRPTCSSPTVLTFRQFCSHHRHGQDKTRQDSLVLSCPCRWYELDIMDKEKQEDQSIHGKDPDKYRKKKVRKLTNL